ncbi:AtpZ/AtpI family protein [Catenulispora sp. NF23]|uniref:AtpZ/AtpI family protein n=1 Tax=Catenulispora pinistramenti TaxID=2705254 RepID=A0ABS5KYF8_9ACTN|nr:AtpZ/AtpI family protein [Catenulispora pinistramenti]MBS2534673.1 AtpZ/AtpI family protein [Catenulispora pinistramenti]MBS2551074.1 AtpZ/AtpI family protein [Catenulispora pinistramenti]
MSSTHKTKSPTGKPQKKVDPASISGYLLAGMVLYGGLGWLVDKWAGTSNVFAPIGVIFGLAAGLFLTFRQVSVLERQEREALLRKRRALVGTDDPPEQHDSQDPQDL